MLASLRTRRASIFGVDYVTGKAFVFGTDNNDLRNPNDVTARWTRTITKACADLPSLPRMTLKGLRHTHATILLKLGINPKVVQERLGHTNIMTTMNIYSHVTESMQADAARALNEELKKHG